MPPGKARQVIGIEELLIDIRCYIKVFITAAIYKVDLQGAAFIIIALYRTSRDGLRIFRQCLLNSFGRNAGEEMIGLDHLFALFFCSMAFIIILDHIGMEVLHEIPVNSLYLFNTRCLRNAQQPTVITDLFHE